MENNRQVIVNPEGLNRQVARHPDRAQSSGLRQARGGHSSSRPNGARTFLSAKRSGDFPVPDMAGWKTRPPVIDLSAVALAKAEAEARETDTAMKGILEKLGI